MQYSPCSCLCKTEICVMIFPITGLETARAAPLGEQKREPMSYFFRHNPLKSPDPDE